VRTQDSNVFAGIPNSAATDAAERPDDSYNATADARSSGVDLGLNRLSTVPSNQSQENCPEPPGHPSDLQRRVAQKFLHFVA
jgi:hypothetical protein